MTVEFKSGFVAEGGVLGTSETGNGVSGHSVSEDGVFGQSQKGRGVGGISESDVGVSGKSTSDYGVFGESTRGRGVGGISVSEVGVYAQSDSNAGVLAVSSSGRAVGGHSGSAIGVYGLSNLNEGVHGETVSGPGGVVGVNNGSGAGVEGSSVNGIGGSFSGGHAPLRLIPGAIVGAPTTGDHQRGELFVDDSGDLFYCREDGTPGNWFRVQLAPGATGFSSEVEGVSPVVPQPSPPAPAGTGRQVHARLGAHEQILTALSFSVVEGTIDSEHHFTGKPEVASNVGNLELIYGYVVPGWWGLYWDRLNGSPLRISTREAPPDVGEGKIWCELGIFLGSTMVHVAASGSTATVPPSLPGRKAGDIEFNSDPQAGGHVGWVWVVPSGSTAGSWKQFGNIEP